MPFRLMTYLLAFCISTGCNEIPRSPSLGQGGNTQNDTYQYESDWRIPSAHADVLGKRFGYGHLKLTDKDSKGIPALAVIVVTLSLPTIAELIVDIRARLVEPGILIDTRNKKIVVETKSSIPKGFILIVDKNGSQLYTHSQLKSQTELAKTLAEVLKE
jgi:hypothetical protein